MTACHLVADRQLALHRDIALHELDYARRQLIAFAQLGDPLVGDLLEHRDLARRHFLNLVDLLVDTRIFILETQALQVAGTHFLDHIAGQDNALRHKFLVGLFVVEVRQNLTILQQVAETLGAFIVQNALLVLQVAVHPLFLRGLNRLRTLVQLGALA